MVASKTTRILTPEQLEERRLYMRAWRAAHAEELRAYYVAYHIANAEKRRAQVRAWREAHPEQCRAYDVAHLEESRGYSRAWRKAHPEEARTMGAAYRATHREEERVKAAAWSAAHPESRLDAERRRRARKANAPINDFTAAQWRALQEAFSHRCAYCGKRAKGHLTQDHVEPLSKGGSHTLSNIVPACRSCNSRKHTGPPLVPVQPLLLVVSPSKKKEAA